jgi:hypothetical protein
MERIGDGRSTPPSSSPSKSAEVNTVSARAAPLRPSVGGGGACGCGYSKWRLPMAHLCRVAWHKDTKWGRRRHSFRNLVRCEQLIDRIVVVVGPPAIGLHEVVPVILRVSANPVMRHIDSVLIIYEGRLRKAEMRVRCVLDRSRPSCNSSHPAILTSRGKGQGG